MRPIIRIFSSDPAAFNEILIDRNYNFTCHLNWAPDCTLGLDLTREMIDKSIKFMHEIKLPLDITIEEIGLIKYPPAQEIVKIPLR